MKILKDKIFLILLNTRLNESSTKKTFKKSSCTSDKELKKINKRGKK